MRRPGYLVLTIALGALSAYLLVGGGLGYTSRYRNIRALLDHGAKTQAAVLSVRDHGEGDRVADYEYEVAGVRYRNTGPTGLDYRERGPVEIVYLPERPNVSAIQLATAMTGFWTELGVWGLFLGFVLLCFVGSMHELRKALSARGRAKTPPGEAMEGEGGDRIPPSPEFPDRP